jgi:hypothetical protein
MATSTAPPPVAQSHYAPREDFLALHDRQTRWGIAVCHRRAGKTVACINDLIRSAALCKLKSPRFAYIAPQLNQAKDIAWAYLLEYTDCLCLIVGGTVWDASTSSSGYALSGGLLTATRSAGSGDAIVRVNLARTSGYFEVLVTATGGNTGVGISHSTQPSADWLGDTSASIGYYSSGSVFYNGSSAATYSTFTAGDRIGVCLKAGKLYFSKNGTWQGGADPSAGTGGIDVSAHVTNAIPAAYCASTGGIFTGAFASGQSYSVPTGVTVWS